MNLTAVAKIKKKLIKGHLEIQESDEGDILFVDIIGGDEYTDSYPPESSTSLYDFFRLTHNHPPTVKRVKELLKAIKATEIYVYMKNFSEFWAYVNYKCKSCAKGCKQSHLVEVVSCKQYKEMK